MSVFLSENGLYWIPDSPVHGGQAKPPPYLKKPRLIKPGQIRRETTEEVFDLDKKWLATLGSP
jgi:hypothetical protein